MRQGWMRLVPCIALVAIMASAPIPAAAAGTSAKGTTVASAEGKSKRTYRQYTGWITALDKASITVEKRGRKPESRVFTRHAGMRATGDVEKSAHVTVFWREEDGKAVAHRVVVKDADAAAKR